MEKNSGKKIANEYNLDNKSSFLQLGCEKGFLLHDLKNILPNLKIHGLETSDYAVKNSMEDVRKYISKTKNYINLEYEDNKFDFILALGVVYTLNLSEAIQCLKEIQRISKGKSFVTLASYETIQDYWLFRQWTLLGTTILLKKRLDRSFKSRELYWRLLFYKRKIFVVKKKIRKRFKGIHLCNIENQVI